MRYLITGGSGYVGSLVIEALLRDGHTCVNFDIGASSLSHPLYTHFKADVTDPDQIETVFKKSGPFDAVVHCAAQLLYTKKKHDYFLKTNVESTRLLAEACIRNKTKHLVYISSNCVYGKPQSFPVKENHPRNPFELYGQTKKDSEDILFSYADRLHTVMLRAPTIVGEGRLGILSIVYDFIRENRRICLVGSGENRYQFVYGPDLAEACKKAALYEGTAAMNVGSDKVPSLNELFQALIQKAKSKSKIWHFPAAIALPGMKLCYHLGISPLGPYQYNMIASSYSGDTETIKKQLGWAPTKTNAEMLIGGFEYYIANYDNIHNSDKLSGHRKPGWGGVLNLIKLLS